MHTDPSRQTGRSTRQLQNALEFAVEHKSRVVYVIDRMQSQGYYKHLIAENLQRPDLLHLVEFKSIDVLRDEYVFRERRLRGWARGSLFIDHYAHRVFVQTLL